MYVYKNCMTVLFLSRLVGWLVGQTIARNEQISMVRVYIIDQYGSFFNV